ncbi:MAG: phosphotransferase [Christensenellales bacterium]|jgi:8-oxo-dGTP diphosphatase
MSETKQYVLGLKAGETLRKIHTLPAPEGAEPWEDWFYRKVQGRIDFYNAKPIKSKNGDRIVRFLKDNKHLLENRPQTFNHGDYNKSNLMVMPDGGVGVIDFNAYNKGYGDPWWEFDPTNWGNEPNAPFCTGLINGYFESLPPNEFFEMHRYYLAYDALAALCDTSVHNQVEPEEGSRHLKNVLRWFNNMQNPVPTWYLSGYELWDVLDKDGNKIGRFYERGRPMNKGEHHLEVSVWIESDNGEYLISQRAPNKMFPNMWECTGGSAVAGDDSFTTVLKEAKEELGVILEPKNGRIIYHHLPCSTAGCNGLIDVWLFRQNVDISTVILAPDETCDVMWASADKIREMMVSGELLDYPYFDEMVEAAR